MEVNFAHRHYVGVVLATDVTPDVDPSRVISVLSISELPPVTENELRLWEFISSYYLCSIGEVYKAAYPSLKLKSEQTALRLSQRKEQAREKMHKALKDKAQRLQLRLDGKLESFGARQKSGRKLNESVTFRLEKEIEDLRTGLQASLKALEEFERKISTNNKDIIPAERKKCPDPTPGKPVLLKASLREETYAGYASSVLKQGGQVLLLTPELAFCDRLEEYFQPIFGDKLIVFNSQASKPEQRKMAEFVRSGEDCIILGTRSSLFLPFTNLKLIIIDEEQDISYKQTEPSPRYNGRDCAIALGGIHSAAVILGSNCPSLETLLNCESGKYGLSNSSLKAVDDCSLDIVDIDKEKKKNGMAGLISRRFIRQAAFVDGPVVLIRGWEKEEEVRRQAEELFSGREIRIMTIQEAKRSSFGIKDEELLEQDCNVKVPLICVLQADALVSRENFRADERARQLVDLLRKFGRNVTIQTVVADRFNNTRDNIALLAERKDFSLPPYTRLVDISFDDSNDTRRGLLFNEFLRSFPRDLGTVMVSGCQIRIALARDHYLSTRKECILSTVTSFETKRSYQGHIIIDVDPA